WSKRERELKELAVEWVSITGRSIADHSSNDGYCEAEDASTKRSDGSDADSRWRNRCSPGKLETGRRRGCIDMRRGRAYNWHWTWCSRLHSWRGLGRRLNG